MGDIGSMTIEEEFAMKAEVKFLGQERIRMRGETMALNLKL